ncbi:uncharacterized protein [Cherax quadricarinatus]
MGRRKCGLCWWKSWQCLLTLALVALVALMLLSLFIVYPTGYDMTQERKLGEKSLSCPAQCPPCSTPLTPPQHRSLPVALKRRLADTIGTVQRQIARLAGTQAVVDAKWALTLAALVEELDPRRVTSAKNNWDHSARLPDMKPAPAARSNTRHVCPEVYFGKSYDHPFHQHGMEPDNCTYVPPLSKVITAVLPGLFWPKEVINFVIAQIRKYYDIPIIALVQQGLAAEIKLQNVRVVHSTNKNTDANILNNLIKEVKTPYVFIGSSLVHFSNQSSLERLVRVLDELDHVEVAGGAARDIQGHWTHGCLQQRMAIYQSTYTMGYYYSKFECMYCDDVLTPFVASTKLMKKVTFSSDLSGPAMYRDWFIKVGEAGHLVMVCPDVMFFLNNHVNMTRESWLPVARRFVLQKISYRGVLFNFTCENININCDNVLNITRSFLLPPCCINIAEEQLNMVADIADKYDLQYELQSGSVLGAIKFGSYLPWDTDHDIFIECKDFKIWYQKLTPIVKAKNCIPITKYKNIFLKIMCPSFNLDIFCRKKLSRKFLPAEYIDIPTTIWYSGRWVKVCANPGLFTRNLMGLEVLKHLQHSTHVNGFDKNVRPGWWLPCRSPHHHSCLDRFPADGNIPFILT